MFHIVSLVFHMCRSNYHPFFQVLSDNVYDISNMFGFFESFFLLLSQLRIRWSCQHGSKNQPDAKAKDFVVIFYLLEKGL